MPRYWMYIFLLAIVTYLIRVLPLTVFHKEIKNKTVLSFLYYVPYITLAVMTFPEILHATMSPYSALLAFVVGIVLAFSGKTLPTIAAACCMVVFLSEWVLVR